MPYKEPGLTTKVRTFAEKNTWIQQFGQPADDSAWDGAAACTHTCWQFIILLWTGKKYTINQISALAGYPYRPRNAAGQPRGLSYKESNRLVDRLNLPYMLKLGLPWETMNDYWKRGPVLYGTRYGSQPDWRGYNYNGTKADGKPNGFAIKYGRTQLTGFENGAHAVLALGTRNLTTASGAYVRMELYRKDPNHGSPARGERPPYDILSLSQSQHEYNSYKNRLGRTLFAFVPTKVLK